MGLFIRSVRVVLVELAGSNNPDSAENAVPITCLVGVGELAGAKAGRPSLSAFSTYGFSLCADSAAPDRPNPSLSRDSARSLQECRRAPANRLSSTTLCLLSLVLVPSLSPPYYRDFFSYQLPLHPFIHHLLIQHFLPRASSHLAAAAVLIFHHPVRAGDRGSLVASLVVCLIV